MKKSSFLPESILLVVLLIFVGCTSGGRYSVESSGGSYSVESNECFNSTGNKQIEKGIELINDVYLLILTDYYKPVSTSTMLFESIKGIESLVGATGCFNNVDGQSKIIHPCTHKVWNQKKLDREVLPFDGKFILEDIYRFTTENKPYYSPENIAIAAIDGLLKSLDENSSWQPVSALKNFDADLDAENVGIGIYLHMENGYVTVSIPIYGAPAQKAGIIAGDKIISVDGKPAKYPGQTLNMLGGLKGSKVAVSIMRGNNKDLLDFVVVRDIYSLTTNVKAANLVPGYRYVHLLGFPEGTSLELENALGKLENWPVPIQGLILDLRNNGGGLLSEAIMVRDLFLEEGKIVTVDLPRQRKKVYMATPNAINRRYSMIVLINEGSMAASEIVAGALQDNKHALILGTKSFGSGSIQTSEILWDGSKIKLTIGFCYTPNERSIETKAIEPDIPVKRNFVSAADYYFNNNPLFRKESPEDPVRKLEVDNQVNRALEILIHINQSKLDI